MKRLPLLSLLAFLLLIQGCLFDDDDKEKKPVMYSISGRVLNHNDTGVEGARVSLEGVTVDDEEVALQTVLSDSDGNFIFEGLSNGSYSVVAALFAVRFEMPLHTVVLNGESVMLDSFIAIPFLPDEKGEYSITFESSWSAETHPLDFPGNPHFSPIIGAYHREDFVFWEEGGLATPGIKELAETGRRVLFTEEILAVVDTDDANVLLWGGGIPVSPGSVTITFTAHRDFHYVSLASMIAPSPDWFTGVSGLNLFEGDDWSERIEIDLYLYDAGTDSGLTYTASNAATPVPETIRKIDDYAFVADGEINPVGTMTFVRTGGQGVGKE